VTEIRYGEMTKRKKHERGALFHIVIVAIYNSMFPHFSTYYINILSLGKIDAKIKSVSKMIQSKNSLI